MQTSSRLDLFGRLQQFLRTKQAQTGPTAALRLLLSDIEKRERITKHTKPEQAAIEDRMQGLLEAGAIAGPAEVDASLACWPTLAARLIRKDLLPSAQGWQRLIDSASRYREFHSEVVMTMKSVNTLALDEHALLGPWVWTPVCELLMERHPTLEVWHEGRTVNGGRFGGLLTQRVITWLAEGDAALPRMLERARAACGLPGQPPLDLPTTQAGLNHFLCRLAGGKRGDLDERPSTAECLRLAQLLLDAGAQPNEPGIERKSGGEIKISAMAVAIKERKPELVDLMLARGATLGWDEVEPALADRIGTMMRLGSGWNAALFSGEKDQAWFLGLLQKHLPSDFDWDRTLLVEGVIPGKTTELNVEPHLRAFLPQIAAQQQLEALEANTAQVAKAPEAVSSGRALRL